MSETLRHRSLVMHLRDHVLETYAAESSIHLFIDLDNQKADPAPPELRGNRPDLYAKIFDTGREIVGEAKTPNDFDTDRSIRQITNFLGYLHKSHGGIFYLCVPWYLEIYAEDVVRDIVETNSFDLSEIRVLGSFQSS